MTITTEPHPIETASDRAARVMRRCDELAHCSEGETGLTRTFLTPAMHNAHEMMREWMREAGMTTRVDALGNLIGHLAAPNPLTNAVFLLGSHLDTVPNAGKYDGMLGVLLAIEVVAALQNELPFAIEVLGFSEEEGVRFRTPYLGSRAIAGTFDPEFLQLRDANGISMRQSLRNFGLDSNSWPGASYQNTPVLGYLEAHIEQGPVLEAHNAPLGIVTAIAGQSRLRLRFCGQAGHAGTQPMNLRRDALAAASQWICAVEEMGSAVDGLVATVGALEVIPNTSNVVPGEVVCSLDVRHADDSVRERAVERLLQSARNLAKKRALSVEILAHGAQKAVPMDATWRQNLKSACHKLGISAPEMMSGAGHDAAIMATLTPTAMLFLRTPGGASHCPEETVEETDVALALDAMRGFILEIARNFGDND